MNSRISILSKLIPHIFSHFHFSLWNFKCFIVQLHYFFSSVSCLHLNIFLYRQGLLLRIRTVSDVTEKGFVNIEIQKRKPRAYFPWNYEGQSPRHRHRIAPGMYYCWDEKFWLYLDVLSRWFKKPFKYQRKPCKTKRTSMNKLWNIEAGAKPQLSALFFLFDLLNV